MTASKTLNGVQETNVAVNFVESVVGRPLDRFSEDDGSFAETSRSSPSLLAIEFGVVWPSYSENAPEPLSVPVYNGTPKIERGGS